MMCLHVRCGVRICMCNVIVMSISICVAYVSCDVRACNYDVYEHDDLSVVALV